MSTKLKSKTPELFTGVGRRKTAVAQIRLTNGKGQFILNGKIASLPQRAIELLSSIDRVSGFDISAIVRGGGFASWEDAITLGIARALIELNPDFKKTLRKAGFVTRDPRVKERKKPGLKRARRAPQWSKR